MIEDARAAVTWLRHLSHSDKVDAIEAAGGPKPTRVRFTTDHSYNDHHIAGGGGELAEATFP